MKEEEGQRRHFDHDHDLLVEIHTMATTLTRGFDKHLDQDKEDFEKIHKRINNLSWYIAMGVGGMVFIEFFLKLSQK